MVHWHPAVTGPQSLAAYVESWSVARGSNFAAERFRRRFSAWLASPSCDAVCIAYAPGVDNIEPEDVAEVRS